MANREEHALGVAIIGTGKMAKQMMQVLIKLNRPITAVYGRSLEKAQALVSELKLGSYTQVYDSLANLWEHDDSHYVYIATSNDMHMKHALDAMFHGKNVLVEKSMVRNVTELAEIERTIHNEKVVFMEANTALCSPLLRMMGNQIKELGEIEGIGKIGCVNINFGSIPEIDPKNRFFNSALGGGMLGDIGCYALAAAVMLLGKDIKIVNSDLEIDDKFKVDVRGHAILKNCKGICASLNMSFYEKLPKSIVLGGSNGYAEIFEYPRNSEYRIYPVKDQSKVLDLKDDIIERYELDKTQFTNFSEIALAVEIIDFESAVFAGFDRTYSENLTHYNESVAIARLTAEIIAKANVTHKTFA